MSKTNFLVKYLKNISNLINNLLEKNLNKLNFKNLSNLLKNNKIILTFVAVFVLFISYLILPNFYNQSDISNELKSQFKNKLGLNLKFSQNIKYNFFPRPHFMTSETSFLYDQNEISKAKNLKIYISIDNLFSFKNIKIKDLIVDNANFNLNKKNYNFFYLLLNENFENGNLIIKNSNIFFRNSDNEVMFINKILKFKYYYEPKEFKNIFYSDNEIFNIPYSMQSYLSVDKSKIFSEINLNLIKLKIKNELFLNNEIKTGKSEFAFNKLKTNVDYQLSKNYINFHIFDKMDKSNISYKGNFNFKPFYATLDGKQEKLNLNYLFGTNAIAAQLLKTEIFNNKNINFKLNINSDNLYDNSNFRNIEIKSNIQNGLIDTDKTKFDWRDFAIFELSESLIFVRNGELVLDGKLIINVDDYNKVYTYLVTPKNYRKAIRQIDLNFVYNFDQKTAELKDIKIDNKINQNLNKILNNIIIKKDDLQNKIYFKNLLNEAIKSYAG